MRIDVISGVVEDTWGGKAGAYGSSLAFVSGRGVHRDVNTDYGLDRTAPKGVFTLLSSVPEMGLYNVDIPLEGGAWNDPEGGLYESSL